jgi:hypothetical protein
VKTGSKTSSYGTSLKGITLSCKDSEEKMKSKIFQIGLLFTVATFFTSGCIAVVGGESVSGSGNIVEAQRDVSEFNRVLLKGAGKVFLSQGEAQFLQIKTDDNIMPLIETDVSGKKLTISHGEYRLKPTVFEVFIVVENLQGVAISGSGDVIGKTRFSANTFYAQISGSGDIELEVEAGMLESKISGSGSIHLIGKADTYAATISGSGEINAFDMAAKNVSVQISGSGDCRISVSEALDAKISGSGDIYYRGRPQVNTKISGSGSLESVN